MRAVLYSVMKTRQMTILSVATAKIVPKSKTSHKSLSDIRYLVFQKRGVQICVASLLSFIAEKMCQNESGR